MNKPIHIPASTLVSHLSASSLSTYCRCPALFRYKYILKRKPQHRSAALVFGSAWGNALAHWLVESSTSELSAQDLQRVFQAEYEQELSDSDVPVVYGKNESKEGLLATAQNMLDVFLRRIDPPDEVLGIETAFSVILEHPDDPDERLEVPVIGAFDAVVVVAGETLIWEFKSAARKYSSAQFEYMLQPPLYNVGARVFGYNDLPVEVLVTTKAKVPDVQVERLSCTRRQERELYDLSESVTRAVQAGIFPRHRSAQTCSGCEYNRECAR